VNYDEYHDVVVATPKLQKNQKIFKSSRSQKATTRVLSAYNGKKPTLLERSETKYSTLEYDQNSLVLCLVAIAIVRLKRGESSIAKALKRGFEFCRREGAESAIPTRENLARDAPAHRLHPNYNHAFASSATGLAKREGSCSASVST